VVVPFYGVEAYIDACLSSIVRQSLASIEVILVDDGSIDGSRSIAERFAEHDARFRLVSQQNLGLGPARNRGAAAATGDFITFVDSDDLVSAFGFERLTTSLQETGSSFAAGSALRFDTETGFRPSWLHRSLFLKDIPGARLDDHPELALDRMIWNKVFCREFWTSGGYQFPGGAYEDYPVSVTTLLDAGTVDMISAPVYFWREREQGDSLTQRAGELDNIADRVESDEFVVDMLQRRFPQALAGVRALLAETDLRAVSQAFGTTDDPDRLLVLAQRLVSVVGDEAGAARPRLERLQHQAIATGRTDLLVELAHLLEDGSSPSTRQVRQRLTRQRHLIDDISSPSIAGLPVASRSIPKASQIPRPVLHGARLANASIELRGVVDVSQIDGAGERVKIRLSRARWSAYLETDSSRPNPAFGSPGIGFGASLPMDLLDSLTGRQGAVRVEAEVRGRKGITRAPVRADWPGSGQLGPGCLLGSGVWAQLSNVGDGVGVNWRRSPIFLDSASIDSANLHLTVTSPDHVHPGEPQDAPLELLVRRPNDSRPIVVARTMTGRGDGEFVIPLHLLDAGAVETIAVPHAPGWSVWLRRSGEPVPILWPPGADPITVSTNRRNLLFTRTATNSLQVCDLPLVPVVTALTLDDGEDQAVLTIRGTTTRTGAPTHWRATDHAGRVAQVACDIIDDGGTWAVESAVDDLRRASATGLTEWRLIRQVGDRHQLAWVAPRARAEMPIELVWKDSTALVIDPHHGTLRLRWWQG
jgi:CDP-glycerol glycerophosphotransferase